MALMCCCACDNRSYTEELRVQYDAYKEVVMSGQVKEACYLSSNSVE
jgi:hypothetical protein